MYTHDIRTIWKLIVINVPIVISWTFFVTPHSLRVLITIEWGIAVCSKGRRKRVRERVGDLMMDSDGHGQYLAPCEDLVKFGALCQFLEHF